MAKGRTVLLVGGGLLGVALLGMASLATYLATAYPDAGPVPDITLDPTPERLARGAYLFDHVAGCGGCHTPRDVSRVGHPADEARAGAGGNPFGGENLVVYASNITPAGIGEWTDGELWHAITTGVTPSRYSLFAIMPWPNYAQMSREDVRAVLAWTRTLAPVQAPPNPKRSLPGPLPLLVNFFPKAANNPETAPDPADTVAYGEYLVQIASCRDCHTPSEKGRAIEGLDLAGGFPLPVSDGSGVSTTANITPDDATGIGTWTRAQFVGAFKRHLDDETAGMPIPPGAPNTMMPWRDYAGMTEGDLGAIYDYLRTVPAIDHAVSTWTPAEGTPLAEGPTPPPRPPGIVSRGAVGALCDTLAADRLPYDRLVGPELDPGALAAARERAEARRFDDFAALAGGLASRPPHERDAWLRQNIAHHGLADRCGPVVGVPPVAAPPEDATDAE